MGDAVSHSFSSVRNSEGGGKILHIEGIPPPSIKNLFNKSEGIIPFTIPR
jgi:hypothetical protein